MYKKSVLGGVEFDVTDFDVAANQGRSYRRSLLLRNGEKVGESFRCRRYVPCTTS